jgi:hypothetical protein
MRTDGENYVTAFDMFREVINSKIVFHTTVFNIVH